MKNNRFILCQPKSQKSLIEEFHQILEELKVKTMRTREQAIKTPQVGDRWEFPNGISYELTHTHTPINSPYIESTVTQWMCREGSSGQSIFFAREGKDFSSKVHSAKFLGNFAVVQNKRTKEDALKNPQLGDRWSINNEMFQVGDISENSIVLFGKKEYKTIRREAELFNATMCWHDFIGNFSLKNL